MPTTLAKPIVGIITGRVALLADLLLELRTFFGAHDIIGEWKVFDQTDYYEPEMGRELFRTFVSFEKLVPSERAHEFKGWAVSIEKKFAIGDKRIANIDPGYVDANKVVLVTGKHGGHKIALAQNVWADLLLRYERGWVALPWAFPDFKDGSHSNTFMKMRERFKSQINCLSNV